MALSGFQDFSSIRKMRACSPEGVPSSHLHGRSTKAKSNISSHLRQGDVFLLGLSLMQLQPPSGHDKPLSSHLPLLEGRERSKVRFRDKRLSSVSRDFLLQKLLQAVALLLRHLLPWSREKGVSAPRTERAGVRDCLAIVKYGTKKLGGRSRMEGSYTAGVHVQRSVVAYEVSGAAVRLPPTAFLRQKASHAAHTDSKTVLNDPRTSSLSPSGSPPPRR